MEFVEREPRPYVWVKRVVTMTTFDRVAHQIPVLFGWLAQRGVAPVEAPFLKYDRIDAAADEFEVRAGLLVADPVDGDDTVSSGVLPGGRYAKTTHHGSPDGLHAATAALLEWGAAQGVTWDASADERQWGARLEMYWTDPAAQPDPNQWRTDVLIRTAGQE